MFVHAGLFTKKAVEGSVYGSWSASAREHPHPHADKHMYTQTCAHTHLLG